MQSYDFVIIKILNLESMIGRRKKYGIYILLKKTEIKLLFKKVCNVNPNSE